MARMTCNVYVLTEEGESLLLTAGTTPPKWALSQLGAHTLEDAEAEAEPEQSDPHEGKDNGKAAAPEIPPVKGPGSSAKAWAEYAKKNGFDVDSDAKAADIREALAEAGIPVE